VSAFEQKPGRALVVWLVVIGTHTLLIYGMVRNDQVVIPIEVRTVANVELTWIPPSTVPPGDAATPATRERPRTLARQAAEVDDLAEPVLPPVVPVPTAPPSTDWHTAAERAARLATTGDRKSTRDFTSSPTSPYRDCERKMNNFEWKPDAHRTGWANGLPYVRAGKRCVVGLGFFGCKLDPELPPPDGELFADMNTANQMDGTVPGPQDCVTAP
jgi:hypothetical protein